METKRAKVIMLPTYTDIRHETLSKIPIGAIIKTFDSSLNYNKGLYPFKGARISNYSKQMYQHLYFITDDEIKEGDWYLDIIHSKIHQCTSNSYNKHYPANCKKIVATTDTSLGLAKPSQAFIEKYCKLGGIDEVLIEMEHSKVLGYCANCNGGSATIKCNCIDGKRYHPINRIKVDSHNTITIHPIKDSWSGEEVESILHKCRLFLSEDDENFALPYFNEWIKENLK